MKKVLVVNDSRFERKIMKDMLIELDYEVRTSDEYTALDLLDSYNPEIIIANMNMNNIRGDQLIKEIKEKNLSIRCYLSSCSEIAPEYLNSKLVDGYLATPTNIHQLMHLLIEADMELDVEPRADSVFTQDLRSDVTEKPFAFCPYCGNNLNKLEGKYAFCPFCGTKM